MVQGAFPFLHPPPFPSLPELPQHPGSRFFAQNEGLGILPSPAWLSLQPPRGRQVLAAEPFGLVRPG